MLASHRIGLELLKLPKATGTRGQLAGGNIKLPPDQSATLAELTGYERSRGLGAHDRKIARVGRMVGCDGAPQAFHQRLRLVNG